MSRLSPEKVQRVLEQNKVFAAGIKSVELEKHAAFSHASKLARYIVALDTGETKSIRANVWPVSAFRIAEAVAAHSPVSAPKPIYYDPRTTVVLYQELLGDTLRSVPLTLAGWRGLPAKVAKLLAAFQQTPIPKGLASETNAARTQRRDGLVKRIAAADKSFGRLAKATALLLNTTERQHRGRLQVLTHGDFQASNILQHQGKLALLDFTLSRPDHPAIDPALWLVHWQAMSRGHFTVQERERLGHAFLRSYLAAIPATWRHDVRIMLPAYVAEATLEVAATTVLVYGGKDMNVRTLLHELFSSLHFS